jgi:hypothetical protein
LLKFLTGDGSVRAIAEPQDFSDHAQEMRRFPERTACHPLFSPMGKVSKSIRQQWSTAA